MGGDWKKIVLLVGGIALSASGVLSLLDSYKAWSAQNDKVALLERQVAGYHAEIGQITQFLRNEDRVELKETIANAALDFMFNVTKEGLKRDVVATVSIRGGGNGQTVDFKKIAERVEGTKHIVRIPIMISVRDWKGSDQLFSWMDESVMRRQFKPSKLYFTGSAITLEGHLYGKEQ